MHTHIPSTSLSLITGKDRLQNRLVHHHTCWQYIHWQPNCLARPRVCYIDSDIAKSLVLAGHLLYASPLASRLREIASGRSVVETCILPIPLYGAENWCPLQNSTQRLDFPLVRGSWYYYGIPTHQLPLCLTRKLNFLRKISSVDHSETASSLTLTSFSDDIDSVCLIRECRARPGAIFSLQLHRGNSSTGSCHLPPPTRNKDIL